MLEDNLEERVAMLEDLAKTGTLRSCFEYSQYGLKTSGLYMIDPDGGLVGQEPFQVYCNFSTGATEVMHDSESENEVGHCHDPGCYQKNITYINGLTSSAISMYQIISLIELASYCEQDFHYDCTLAPLMDESINYAFWEDRHGEKNIYYTGSNYGEHVCDCHYTEEGCMEEETKHNKCNCDANLPIPASDTGTITNVTALPVKKMFFGGMTYELQSGKFKLGRLRCYGNKDVDIGTSCANLKMKGIMTSGYYNIKPTGSLHTKIVFCDMKSGTYDDVPQVDEISSSSPLGTILPWVPKPEPSSETNVTLPYGWLPCDGRLITEGPWQGGKTPDLRGEFLRGGTIDNVLEKELDEVQNHEHLDPGHNHPCSATSTQDAHSHGYLRWDCCPTSSGDVHIGSGSKYAYWTQSYASDSAQPPISTSCTNTKSNSNLGGVASPSRAGTETRPRNMKTIYIMRCF